MNNTFSRWLVISGAAVWALAFAATAHAQSQPSAHNMQLSSATESIDSNGRVVLIANTQGDLPGVLTVAMTVGPDGRVSSGEWALSVSYNQLSGTTQDGTAGTTLVQQGTLKGAVSGGFAAVGGDGLVTDLNGLQLSLASATLQFASATTGTGTANGNHMNDQAASNGTLTLTF